MKVLHDEQRTEPTGDATANTSQSQTLATDSGLKAIKPLLYIIVVLLVLTLGGIGLFFFTRTGPQKSDRFLVVQSNVQDEPKASDEADKSGKPEDALSPSPEKGTEEILAQEKPDTETKSTETKTIKHRRPPTKKTADGPNLSELTGAFRKQKGKIHRCFEKHKTSSELSQNVSVLFTLQPSGKVNQVQLSPKSLNGTDLGNCLLTVSRATTFPPQSDAISFRIPLSAKRVKQ
jgi:hypothetical protein